MHLITYCLLAALALTTAIPSSLNANMRSALHPSTVKFQDSDGCTGEGFFPNPTDCLKFFRCVTDPRDGSLTRYDFDCAPGTDLWCQSLLTCSFEDQCPEGCSSNSSSSSAAHNQQSDQDTPTNQSRTHVSDCDDASACTSEGLFPHPCDCAKYLHCDRELTGETAYREYDCPPGTDLWCQSQLDCSPRSECEDNEPCHDNGIRMLHPNGQSDQHVLTNDGEAPLRSAHHEGLRK